MTCGTIGDVAMGVESRDIHRSHTFPVIVYLHAALRYAPLNANF